MNVLLTPFLRRIYVFMLIVSFAYGAITLAERSPWNRERLYHRLMSGPRPEQVRAAARLVIVSGQTQLLRALRQGNPETREIASNALWELWCRAAGPTAYELVVSANEAVQEQDLTRALNIINRVVARYPLFPEGWNRRAQIYWQTGHYRRSMQDCRRALALNPVHYAAWQGLGMCQVHLGEIANACRSLASALRLNPQDTELRRALEQCLSVRQLETSRPRFGEERI